LENSEIRLSVARERAPWKDGDPQQIALAQGQIEISIDISWSFVMRSWARINQQGRIVIPAECRAAAGLKPGDDLMIEPIGEGELRLRTRRQAIKEAQAIVARYLPKRRDLVQELIDERRDEAARE
jgi:AbrB family looped-hinge helix DNA binding protein